MRRSEWIFRDSLLSTLRMKNMNDPVKLVSIGGDTSIYIDVRINENGDLLFSGQILATRRNRSSVTLIMNTG